VLHTTRKTTRTLVTLTTGDDVVLTTPDHLFARADGSWVQASRLQVGERLVSAGLSSAVVVTGTVTTQVPATDVYNLTVEKTHTYAVSSRRLLVHNVNCWSSGPRPAEPSRNDRTTLADLLAREREQEQRRKDQIRLELSEHNQRLAQLRRTFNDSHGNTNCVYCTLGGLSDYDKLSAFIKDSGLDERQPTSDRKNRELLERFKLRTSETPPSATFQKKRMSWPSRQDPQRDANKFMQESSSNTFALIIKGSATSPIGHSLIAVRKPDGSIVYLDLQKVPPEAYDRVNPLNQFIEVIPTDVDWRHNRQLATVVQSSPLADPKRGWPK
jgi:hypothetical protein